MICSQPYWKIWLESLRKNLGVWLMKYSHSTRHSPLMPSQGSLNYPFWGCSNNANLCLVWVGNIMTPGQWNFLKLGETLLLLNPPMSPLEGDIPNKYQLLFRWINGGWSLRGRTVPRVFPPFSLWQPLVCFPATRCGNHLHLDNFPVD